MRIEDDLSKLHVPGADYQAVRDEGFATIRPRPPQRLLKSLVADFSLRWNVNEFASEARPWAWAKSQLFEVRADEVRGPVSAIASAVERMRKAALWVEWDQKLEPRATELQVPTDPKLRSKAAPLVHALRQRWRGVFVAECERRRTAVATSLPALLPNARFLYVLSSRRRVKEFADILSERHGYELGSRRPDNHDRRIFLSEPRIFSDLDSLRYDVVVWPNATDLLTKAGRRAAASLYFFRRRAFAIRLPKDLPNAEDRRQVRIVVGEDLSLQSSLELPYEICCRGSCDPETNEPEDIRLRRAAVVAKELVGEPHRAPNSLGIDWDLVRDCGCDFSPDAVAVVVKTLAQGKRLGRRLPGWPILGGEPASARRSIEDLPSKTIVTSDSLSSWPATPSHRSPLFVLCDRLPEGGAVRKALLRIGAPVIHV